MIIERSEFIAHTPRYLKLAESQEIVIASHGRQPMLALHSSRGKRASDLAGTIKIIINEKDINSHVLEPLE